MRNWSDSTPWPVVGFTLSYIVLAGALVLVRGNGEFVVYVCVMLVLLGLLALVHKKVRLPSALLWCFSLWGLMHMAGGLLECPEGWPTKEGSSRVLYNLWIIPSLFKYDQLTHVFGFGVTTWLCWRLYVFMVRDAGGEPRPGFGALTLCAAGGMGYGALNEIIEFVATLTLPETNVGGYANTGWDLVANLVGSVGAAVWIGLAHRAPRD